MASESCPLGFECEDPSSCGSIGFGLDTDLQKQRAVESGLVIDDEIDGPFLYVCSGLVEREPNDKARAARKLLNDAGPHALQTVEIGVTADKERRAAEAGSR